MVRLNLSPENTAVVLDSTSDLPPAQVRHENWRVVPLYVHFGTDVYRDHVELDAETFYSRLRESSVLPRSSQPSPGDFVACLEELAEYEHVIVLTVSSHLSGTHDSARLAAELDSPGRVRVIDGGTVSAGTVLLAEAVQRRLEEGTTEEELLALADRFTRSSGYVFTVATLDYLVRGGRVSRAAGFAGELLTTKPVLRVVDGRIVSVGRVRGRARALAELLRIFVAETEDDPRVHAAVTDADARSDADALAERVREARPQAALDLRLTMGPVIGSNAGPGAVAIAWFVDDRA